MEPHSFSFHYSQPEQAVHKPSKKAVAPPRPTQPQVYKVDPINFRDVVQKLTAAPEFQDRRLQAMPAPRPNLSNPPPHNGYLGQSAERYYHN